MKTNLKSGKITISRFASNQNPREGIMIELVDKDSGIQFCEVTLTVEQFGAAISGKSYTDCFFEVRGLDLIGKRLEIKTEKIDVSSVPSIHRISDEEAASLLEPYEVDEWSGSVYDLRNYHNYDIKTNTVSVSFVRWV